MPEPKYCTDDVVRKEMKFLRKNGYATFAPLTTRASTR